MPLLTFDVFISYLVYRHQIYKVSYQFYLLFASLGYSSQHLRNFLESATDGAPHILALAYAMFK